MFDNMRRVAREHIGVRLDYLGAAAVPVTEHLAEALLHRLPAVAEVGEMGGLVPTSFEARRPDLVDSVL